MEFDVSSVKAEGAQADSQVRFPLLTRRIIVRPVFSQTKRAAAPSRCLESVKDMSLSQEGPGRLPLPGIKWFDTAAVFLAFISRQWHINSGHRSRGACYITANAMLISNIEAGLFTGEPY